MTDQGTLPTASGLPLRWYAVGIVVPIVISALTQLEFVQGLDGHLIHGLPWDIGRWEIMADVLAPAWAISLIVLAALLRRLVGVWPGPQGPPATGWFAETFLTERWAVRATWMATVGAVLLVLFAWTREWERFGQRPPAFWYVALLAATVHPAAAGEHVVARQPGLGAGADCARANAPGGTATGRASAGGRALG